MLISIENNNTNSACTLYTLEHKMKDFEVQQNNTVMCLSDQQQGIAVAKMVNLACAIVGCNYSNPEVGELMALFIACKLHGDT